MEKTFRLKNLGCANCAAKMERAIAKLDGVQDVSIRFMTQKMILTADDEKLDRITEEIKKTIQKIEPDCILVV